MRLSLTLLIVAATGVASPASAQSEGVAFAGDLDSVDKAFIEAAQLPLPQVAGSSSSYRARTAPQAVAPAPPQQAGAVRQVAYNTAMRAPAASEKMPSGSFFSRLKPKWLFGKDDAKSASTTDPFAQAANAQRKQPAAARGFASRIPAKTGDASTGVEQAGYRRPLFDFGGSKQPPAPQRATPTTNQRRPMASQATLATQKRLPTQKPKGVMSGFTWFGDSDDDSQPTTKGRRPSQTATAKAKPTARPKGVLNHLIAKQETKPKGKPTPRRAPAKPAAATPLAKPAPLATAQPTPKTTATPKATPTPKAPAEPIEQSPLRVFSGVPVEPTGAPVVINDHVAKETLADKASGDEDATKVATSTPTASPIDVYPEVETLASTPTPTDGPAATAKPIEEALPAAEAEPVAAAKPRALPTPAQPTTPVVEPTGDALFASDLDEIAGLEQNDGQPSQRARDLLTEAHGFANRADDYDDYSAIVKRCRYVLAIDGSSQATAYANQLAAWALIERGESLDEVGRNAEAKIDYREALRCDPESWRAVHNLGVAAARDGNRDEALQRFNHTIDINPEYAMAYANRAALSVQSGDYRAAMDDYQRAIDIDPDLAMAHSGRGRVCHMLGRLDEGLRHLDAAEILDPKSATIAGGRADLLVDLGRYGQAKEAYERAIKLDSKSPAAYRNLAWMQATCPIESFRDGDAALENTAKAERLMGRADDLMLDTKAAALAAIGRFGEASTVQQEAITMAPRADAAAYRERLALYEQGEAFTSRPVSAVQQTAYTTERGRSTR